MRTATPVATMSLAGVLAFAVVWQGVNLWRQPRSIAIPMMTPPSVMRDGVGESGAAAAQDESAPVSTSGVDPTEAETPPPDFSGATLSGDGQGPQRASTETASRNAPADEKVDETALRYFARQGDTRRLNAEIARLRSLYPGWTPPEDPLQAAPVADPQLDHMWRLVAEGQFAAAREAIAARRIAEAGWTAPKDLLDRLALAEMRGRLVNASDAKQYGMVIQIGATTPSLRTCADVDVLWRVAEAFVRTGADARAVDAYRYILTRCSNGSERIATMQKAASLLPRDSLAPLLELAQSGAEADAVRSIREDLARRAVAAGAADAKADVPQEDVETLERFAEAGHSVDDPTLLGWYFLRRDDATQAERWFRLSYDRQNAAASAEGLALALLKLKKPADAEAVLARWRDANDDAGKAYMSAATNLLAQQPPPVIAPDVLARVAETAAKRRDAATAQQLGWYSRANGQDETAAQWFAAALAWKPDDEPSAFGLAIVDSVLNRRGALKSLERNWRERSPRILAMVEPSASRLGATAGRARPQGESEAGQAASQQEAAAAANDRVPRAKATRAMRPSSERAAARQDTPAARGDCASGTAGMTQAWCLMQRDRPAEAAAAFRAVLASGSPKDRADAAYGLSLADLRQGLTADAEVAASAAPQTEARASQVSLDILTQRIGAAFRAGNYAEALTALDARARITPETTDLMMMRGWSYYHLHRYDEAARLFEAVAATGYDGALQALDVAKAALGNGR